MNRELKAEQLRIFLKRMMSWKEAGQLRARSSEILRVAPLFFPGKF
jgi:hypothetical protein